MKHWIYHFFIPRHSNNHRAQLLHHDSLLVFTILILTVSLFFLSTKPHFAQQMEDTFGITSETLLQLTNQQRVTSGAALLHLNEQLTQAANMKAVDMFAKNYWAHNAPDGKKPWDFVHAAEYEYIYAGENLARGFTTSEDIINAWMASPTHRENMLSSRYESVGFAIKRGTLTGEKDTILIVEMLGGQTVSADTLLQKPQSPHQTVLGSPTNSGRGHQDTIDTFIIAKFVGIGFIGLFLSALIIDIIIISRKKIARVAGHSADHLIFLGVIVIAIFFMQKGFIF